MRDENEQKAPALVLSGEENMVLPTPTPTAASPLNITETAAPLEDSELTEEEKAAVEEFSKKIDLHNSNIVLLYGSEAQKNISSFSEMALSKVRTKDMGEVGAMLGNLVTELNTMSFNKEEPRGLKKLFNKGSNTVSNFKTKYATVEKNVDRISNNLENHRLQLIKDIAMLDQMYEMNVTYYKELTMYILAGKKKLSETRAAELPALQQKAQASGKPEDSQAANDLANMCDRFEKKLHDLELTRTVSIQMAPQIRLVQNNDSVMAEKIQSSLLNTIPLWKNQMVLALGIHHSRQAMEAQREVTNMTNQLLKKNAELLKTGTVETAREAERGVIDVEAIKYTNENLIATFNEVIAIQEEGRVKRREAEGELRRIEDELKGMLLGLRDRGL